MKKMLVVTCLSILSSVFANGAEAPKRQPNNTDNAQNVQSLKLLLLGDANARTISGQAVTLNGVRPDGGACQIEITATAFAIELIIPGDENGHVSGNYRVSTAATYSVDFSVTYEVGSVKSSQIMEDTGGERSADVEADLDLSYAKNAGGVIKIKELSILNNTSVNVDANGNPIFEDANSRTATCTIL